MSRRTELVLHDVEDTIASLLKGTDCTELLDVGCWDGRATKRYGSVVGAQRLCGLEFFELPIRKARENGVDARQHDLETGRLPYEDGRFDVVVCNQVFEHLKNIFDALTEIHRVLKTDGILVFSVPNLASLHNRVLLAAGAQPTSIRIVGPHVRGFSYHHTLSFLVLNGHFRVEDVRGCGFYPFPISIGRWLARAIPSAAHTMVAKLRKRTGHGPLWDDVVRSRGFQTVFLVADDPTRPPSK